MVRYLNMVYIVDPNSYNKKQAFEDAQTLVREFLDLNSLSHPVSMSDVDIFLNSTPSNMRGYGLYDFKTTRLIVNVKKSRTPVKTPGFSWSYTGYKADLTIPGILCHEIGHHTHNMRERDLGVQPIKELLKSIRANEKAVSSYEPNVYETFAEMTKLFVLNPNLLKLGRPLRWSFLTQDVQLKPLHDEPWKNVLVNAHEKLIAAAEKWTHT